MRTHLVVHAKHVIYICIVAPIVVIVQLPFAIVEVRVYNLVTGEQTCCIWLWLEIDRR
jgi:hypothetical protein